MFDKPLETWLAHAWDEMQRPGVLWQLIILVLGLGLAALAHRHFERRWGLAVEGEGRVARLRRGGLRRLVFPVAGAIVLQLASLQLRALHQRTELLQLAVELLLTLAIIRMVLYVLRHAFAPSAYLALLERSVATVIWAMFALDLVGLLPSLIHGMEEITLPIGPQKLSLWVLLNGVVTVLATLVIALWVSGLVETRLLTAQGVDASLRLVFSRLAKAALITLAVLISLPMVGIDLTTLSVFGGAIGVGLGFGMQKIASNYVSGFIILLDRSIRIGNMIGVGSDRGQVTKITTRYTVLRGLTGVESLVPNELLVGSVVLNESYTDPKVRVPLQIQVSYGSDVERAMRILVDAAKRHPRVLADPQPKAFLSAFADSGINLEMGFWIADPQEGTLSIRSDINLEVWRAFKAAGIEIPFPQREVRILDAVPGGASFAVATESNAVLPHGGNTA